ncbi:MAG TPA: 5-formyltetrahydrofolate cyclo-ligase [Burkholderiaceae bacterium]|nr:5-formyltetrahydrofolate cyclo-ligase [Burkholderiaceae bacterium]
MDSADARKVQRERALALRNDLGDRAGKEVALRDRVARWLASAEVRAVGFFWPVRGEPDLRSTVAEWLAADAGRVAALPRIAGETLEFHQWHPEGPMQAGAFGIPVPAHGRVVQPDCLLIPCVGFDNARFRLGYGGGYYDRTYATLVPWPLAVGIAFDATRVDTIDPRPHDMQLDVVLTDLGQY